MGDNDVSGDYTIAKLIDMGFEFSKAKRAVETVGPCLDAAVEFLVNGLDEIEDVTGGWNANDGSCSSSRRLLPEKKLMPVATDHHSKQSGITDHLPLSRRTKTSSSVGVSETVGPCLDAAFEFMLNGFDKLQDVTGGWNASNGSCSSSRRLLPEKKLMPVHTDHRLKQSSITDHFSLPRRTKASSFVGISEDSSRMGRLGCGFLQESEVDSNCVLESAPRVSTENVRRINPAKLKFQEKDHRNLTLKDLNREQKLRAVLVKHFGFSSLKGFQKEAIDAWLAHRDCFVLAATGSGKSLCFQLPALLSGQVVVVISPLISLMRDQCLKLEKHGISACYLGSGQPDSTIEKKAMSGIYELIYVCPETLLRLVDPLRRLAEKRGIALFAIDEAHCISKWGHDFRPDYRRLSILRENFKACNLKSLKFDIPLMALTATATVLVRQDIIKSLMMSEETEMVLTSLFRPNLRFSVQHSRTTSTSSYHKDFSNLIETYTMSRMKGKEQAYTMLNDCCRSRFDADESSAEEPEDLEDCYSDYSSTEISSARRSSDTDEASSEEHEDLEDCHGDSSSTETGSADHDDFSSSEEDELDIHQNFDDLDVCCGEFCIDFPDERHGLSLPYAPLAEFGSELQGPTIIYVPTRKETLKIAQFLCKCGVKAAAYHAVLPKNHLRRVHEEFHNNTLEVVVATIAFGMGIDKSNVRRIIHYGWPQSLEAYYQEAGRAGRDGKPSDCILYANLSRIPTLLPSKRSEAQTKHAYEMLSDCFRYGMNTGSCRTKILVNYFGEDFGDNECHSCDVCVSGPPELQNLAEEARGFLQVLATQYGKINHGISSQSCEPPNFRMVVSRVLEKCEKFSSSERLWWQGLGRILKDKGYIKEKDGMIRVAVKYPELTRAGMKFLLSRADQTLFAYPEADMLISRREQKPYSTSSDWGRGWADPEIRRQRLQRIRNGTKKRKRRPRTKNPDLRTVRGRIASKLSKQRKK